MNSTPSILFIGELNPYGASPEFALYRLPVHASGAQLLRHLRMAEAAYDVIPKVNLCTGAWDLPKAQARAQSILHGTESVPSSRGLITAPSHLLLLGRNVQYAFGVVTRNAVDVDTTGPRVRISAPHPSGRNQTWSDPQVAQRLRDVLRDIGVPVGA